MLPPGFDLDRLSPEQQDELLRLLEDEVAWKGRRLFHALYPDDTTVWDGPTNKDFARGAPIYARHLYPKHLEFFDAGARYRERCFMAANRVSKTLGGGAYETTCHLTGLYPAWWPGHRFKTPVRAWAAGKTNETTRDIVQATLLGEVKPGARKTVTGTGVIPGDEIGPITWKQGVADLVDTVRVRHVSGGWSMLGLKSYQQGRDSFEGTAQHFIWLDEEPPLDIYGECLIRTATTKGRIALTFTPLEGLSEVVMQFLPQDMRPDAA